jgi:hypothetical protein
MQEVEKEEMRNFSQRPGLRRATAMSILDIDSVYVVCWQGSGGMSGVLERGGKAITENFFN